MVFLADFYNLKPTPSSVATRWCREMRCGVAIPVYNELRDDRLSELFVAVARPHDHSVFVVVEQMSWRRESVSQSRCSVDHCDRPRTYHSPLDKPWHRTSSLAGAAEGRSRPSSHVPTHARSQLVVGSCFMPSTPGIICIHRYSLTFSRVEPWTPSRELILDVHVLSKWVAAADPCVSCERSMILIHARFTRKAKTHAVIRLTV